MEMVHNEGAQKPTSACRWLAAMTVVATMLFFPALQGQAGGQEPAQAASDLVGSWNGTVAGIRPPQTITLTITAVVSDNPAGTLHFGGARACQLEMDYGAEDAAHYFFTTKRPTGGYCNQLDFGSLDLAFASAPDAVTFTLSKKDGTVMDTGTVRRTTR